MGSLAQKKESVQALQEKLKDSSIALVLDYRGLSVHEMTTMRRELYKNDADLTVAKNTLLKRAIKGTEMEPLSEALQGPTAIAIGRADQVVPVKILKEYLKKNKKQNELRGGFLDGKFLSAKEVEALADLPSFDELRAKLVGGIASPLNGIVAALSSPQRALVSGLDQLAEQKQQQEQLL